jgi:hypothetical protein
MELDKQLQKKSMMVRKVSTCFTVAKECGEELAILQKKLVTVMSINMILLVKEYHKCFSQE